MNLVFESKTQFLKFLGFDKLFDINHKQAISQSIVGNQPIQILTDKKGNPILDKNQNLTYDKKLYVGDYLSLLAVLTDVQNEKNWLINKALIDSNSRLKTVLKTRVLNSLNITFVTQLDKKEKVYEYKTTIAILTAENKMFEKLAFKCDNIGVKTKLFDDIEVNKKALNIAIEEQNKLNVIRKDNNNKVMSEHDFIKISDLIGELATKNNNVSGFYALLTRITFLLNDNLVLSTGQINKLSSDAQDLKSHLIKSADALKLKAIKAIERI